MPLGFLGAAAVGLVGFGLAVALAARDATDAPTAPGVIAAVHVGVLAFLTTGVLGALHQFAPVVGRRPLRSVPIAVTTMIAMVLAGWLLPTGFAHGPEDLVVIGGACGALAVVTAVWNLSGPLAARDGGVPVVGLRASLGYLVVTVAFGVVYAIDRRSGWFPLLPHRVLAHAHLGLLGWLGLTYIAVAEKLWPMFLLAHRPGARSGAVAVGAVASGVAPLALGLLLGLPRLALVGAALVVVGLVAHLTSLAGALRHRRRSLELLHGFLFASETFLVVAVGLAATLGFASLSSLTRSRLVTAEVAALMAWLALALIGHAHKVVPFITYTRLRARGIRTNRRGGPLLFSDLYDHRVARATFAFAFVAFAAAVAGLAVGSPVSVRAAGLALAVTGVTAAANLGRGPVRAARTEAAA